MQVFKAFFKIASKHMRSNCIYFAIYLVIITALTLTTKSSMDANFQSTSLDLCIVDYDHSDASAALTSYLGTLHHVTDSDYSDEELADQLYYRTLDYVLTIPEGFEEKLLAGDNDGLLSDRKIPGGSRGRFVDQQITQYLDTIRLYLNGGFSITEAIAHTDDTLGTLPAPEVLSFSEKGSADNSVIFYFFQYVPYIFILILFVGLAPILVIENRAGIRERTLCSSLSLTRRNFSLAAASAIYALFTWLVFMLAGFVLYRGDLFEPFSLLAMANSLVFLIFAVSITLLVSLFAPNDNILNMLSNILGLSMAFLCGVFVPQSMLSDKVLAVGRFLPAYWYIKANNLLSGLSEDTFTMEAYLQCLGIELLFAAAVFLFTLALSRVHRKR